MAWLLELKTFQINGTKFFLTVFEKKKNTYQIDDSAQI